MMDTTVIIPNYNGMKYIGACLDSLRASGDRDCKIIVVDDGSSDGSAEFIRSSYPEIHLIVHESNRGFAASVNTGIRAADTPYVLLLNNDTVVRDHFVSNLERVIAADRSLFSVNAKMLKMDDPDVLDGAGDQYCALGWAFACGKDRKADVVAVKSNGPKLKVYLRLPFFPPAVLRSRSFKASVVTDVQKGILVPDTAVITREGKNKVFLLQGNSPVLQDVEGFPSDEKNFFIEKGVRHGDKLILDANTIKDENGRIW